MSTLKNPLMLMIAASLFLSVSACHSGRGPGQTAGRKIDQGIEKTGEGFEKAGEKMQDAAHGH